MLPTGVAGGFTRTCPLPYGCPGNGINSAGIGEGPCLLKACTVFVAIGTNKIIKITRPKMSTLYFFMPYDMIQLLCNFATKLPEQSSDNIT